MQVLLYVHFAAELILSADCRGYLNYNRLFDPPGIGLTGATAVIERVLLTCILGYHGAGCCRFSFCHCLYALG